MLNDRNEIESYYQYDAFGETIAQEGNRSRLQYNSQVWDELSGLYYLRARNYNPRIGRFTQEDIVYNDDLNLYAYCRSNPVIYSDPSGFASNNGIDCTPKSGKETPKTDFYGTPSGDIIPADKVQFENNLSMMDEVGGKNIGETSTGPVRVRIEGPHPLDENFNGDWDSDHFIDHIHIEHRKNGTSGQGGKGWRTKITIPLDWIFGDD